jgi:hypothetical protein
MQDTRSIHYLKFWNLVFSHLLNWTEEQVEHWARKWLDQPSPIFYHESASYYASAPFLRRIAGVEGSRHQTAANGIRHLLHHVERQMVKGDEIDWSIVRAEIDYILGEAERA